MATKLEVLQEAIIELLLEKLEDTSIPIILEPFGNEEIPRNCVLGKLNVGVCFPHPVKLNTAYNPPRYSHVQVQLKLYDMRYEENRNDDPTLIGLAALLIDRLHEAPIPGFSSLQAETKHPISLNKNSPWPSVSIYFQL